MASAIIAPTSFCHNQRPFAWPLKLGLTTKLSIGDKPRGQANGK